MFGWLRRADSRASSRNISTCIGSSMLRRRFTTTSLLNPTGPRATARNTSAIPPWPRRANGTNLPSAAGGTVLWEVLPVTCSPIWSIHDTRRVASFASSSRETMALTHAHPPHADTCLLRDRPVVPRGCGVQTVELPEEHDDVCDVARAELRRVNRQHGGQIGERTVVSVWK